MHVYGLYSQTCRLNASAITAEELELWRVACPADVPYNYLAQPEYREKRLMVVRVIAERWIRLYEGWFNELRVEELMQADQ